VKSRFRASGGHIVRGEELDPMKKFMSGLAIAAIASTAFVGAVSAQTDTASGGNGGVSNANANGGAVGIGNTGSGGSSGGATSVGSGGNIGGGVSVGGGSVGTGDDLAESIINVVLGRVPQ
jgi:hypothetical protein